MSAPRQPSLLQRASRASLATLAAATALAGPPSPARADPAPAPRGAPSGAPSGPGARPAEGAPAAGASDCARARRAGRPCVLTLEGETLEGGAPTAGETTALALAFARARSLIRLRRDFVPEVARSADDL